ncbi:MAG: undecaprenyl-diphosphate phosphatase [Clostridiales bacterium]
MEWLQSIFLGIVQGFTQFLPVSDSGHLSILQYFMGIQESGLTFNAILIFAALVSVIFCYHKDILHLIFHPFQKYMLLIIVSCIPGCLVGVFFGGFISQLFTSAWVPAIALLFTAGILFLADNFRGNKLGKEIDIKTAVFIGIFQMFALIPGISRSGFTIFAALLFGMKRNEAAKFSFIMSIPIMLVALLLEVLGVFKETGTFTFEPLAVISGVASMIAGIIAIKFVVKLLNNGKFRYFAIYCTIISIISIILLSLGM